MMLRGDVVYDPDTGNGYKYDAEGNITEVDQGTSVVAKYYYDALNQRVRSETGGAAYEYIFDQWGKRLAMQNGSTGSPMEVSLYWPNGGPVLGFDWGWATHFQHQDFTGTERLRTGYDGSVEGKYTSQPFGDAQATVAGSTNGANPHQYGDLDAYHYSELDHDSESGLEHAQFRHYNSAHAHWMSPDPYSGSYDITNPQSFNRYAYVLNNPMRHRDRLGLELDACYSEEECSGDGGFGGGLGESGGGSPTDPGGQSVDVTATPDPPVPTIPSNCDLDCGNLTPTTGPSFNAEARSNVPLTPQAQGCQAKIQGAVNNALNTNSTFLGPTVGPGMDSMGFRNGAYNFNYFAPGVVNPVAGSNGGSGRFPGSGLHIPLPGGADPTIMPWGYNAAAGGSYFTAHFDSANPTDDLVSFFEHIINDVILRRPHGC